MFVKSEAQARPAKLTVSSKQAEDPYFAQLILSLGDNLVPPVLPEDIVTFEYDNSRSASFSDMGSQARAIIDEHITTTGAVLLRGLPFNASVEACEQFVLEGLRFNPIKYEPIANKRKQVGQLDLATNIPGSDFLDTHNEMVYNPPQSMNDKTILICLKPAQEGGESLLANASEIYSYLPPSIIHQFEQRQGVKYVRTYLKDVDPVKPYLPTWAVRAGTDDPAAAEQFWWGLGCSTTWEKANGLLVVWNVNPAVVQHAATGKPLWVNLAHFGASFSTSYGNGEQIEAQVLVQLMEARLRAMKVLQLGAGDVMVLDNHMWLHGRLPFTGTDRSMVTVLTKG